MMNIKGESVKADIMGVLRDTGTIPVKTLIHKLEVAHPAEAIELGVEELDHSHFVEIDSQKNISLSRKANVLAKAKLKSYRDDFRSKLSIGVKIK